MATNTNLTSDLAKELVKGQKVICSNCNKSTLSPRYKNKNINTEFKCDNCDEIYHPCKLI